MCFPALSSGTKPRNPQQMLMARPIMIMTGDCDCCGAVVEAERGVIVTKS